MKKILIITLVMLLALTLAACSSDNKDEAQDAATNTNTSSGMPGENSASSSETEGKAMDSLIQWMIGGTFSYDFTMTSEGNGEKSESTGSMAVDGKNVAVVTEMTVDGQPVKSRVIIKDDTTYVVDDINKFIIKMPGTDTEAMSGMISDYSGIALVNSGTGEINGKTLPYEEYSESNTSATIRYYLDGGQVYGIESEYEGFKTVMVITNPKNSAPAEMFALPEGYTQM